MYIPAMPPIEADPQSAAPGLVAAIHAISAKVGEAARPSQPAGSPHPVTDRVAIFRLPIAFILFSPCRTGETVRPDARDAGVTIVTGFAWTR